MYYEVKSIIRKRGRLTDVAVQCGISRGIPIIKMYGSISREYARYRELLPFTFAQIGRRLPQRKIHVNYSSNERNINDRDLDLPTAIALFGASTGMHEHPIYALGELSMDGKLKPSEQMGALLYILHHRPLRGKAVVIGANSIDDVGKLYPKIEYFHVSNLLEALRSLEGDLKYHAEPGSVTSTTTLQRSPPFSLLREQLASLFGLNSVLIGDIKRYTSEKSNGTENIKSSYSDDINFKRVSIALGKLFSTDMALYPTLRGIEALEGLSALLEAAFIPCTTIPFELIIPREEVSESSNKNMILRSMRRRLGVTLILPPCNCASELNCSCTSIERLNHRGFIHELTASIGFLEFENDQLLSVDPSFPIRNAIFDLNELDGSYDQRRWLAKIHLSKNIPSELKATLDLVSHHTEENLSLL